MKSFNVENLSSHGEGNQSTKWNIAVNKSDRYTGLPEITPALFSVLYQFLLQHHLFYDSQHTHSTQKYYAKTVYIVR